MINTNISDKNIHVYAFNVYIYVYIYMSREIQGHFKFKIKILFFLINNSTFKMKHINNILWQYKIMRKCCISDNISNNLTIENTKTIHHFHNYKHSIKSAMPRKALTSSSLPLFVRILHFSLYFTVAQSRLGSWPFFKHSK